MEIFWMTFKNWKKARGGGGAYKRKLKCWMNENETEIAVPRQFKWQNKKPIIFFIHFLSLLALGYSQNPP